MVTASFSTPLSESEFKRYGPGEYEFPDWDKKPLLLSASKVRSSDNPCPKNMN
jgi:hypothetical protein